MIRTALPVTIVAAVFGLAVAQVASALSGAATYQTDVREAQIYRARAFRMQLDEETGLRGYASAGRLEFLQPFERAKPRHERAFRDLETSLRRLDIASAVGPRVADERRLHRRWMDEVAAPLLRDRNRPDRARIELLGKNLTDTYREDDRAVFDALIAAASSADAALHAAFVRIVAGASVIGFVAIALFAFAAARRAALEREIATQRQLYETEKRIADTLQSAFFQRDFPQTDTLGLHAVYVPAGQQSRVGGDWYDAFMLPEGRVLFSLGDVAGHGLEAAITMSRVRQAIIAGAVVSSSPAEILANANRALMLQDDRMVTAVCGFVDTRSLEIHYALAGHPPPVLMNAGGEPAFLNVGGMALGVSERARYLDYATRGSPGAVLVLYTDGAVEYGRDIVAGERRLLDAIRARGRADDPAAAIREAVFAGTVPNDDVAIMSISFRVAAPIA